MMKAYYITTKADSRVIPAANRKQAFSKYFLCVKEGQVRLDQLGQVIMLRDPENGEEYPFRVVPTLWQMGLMSEAVAVENLRLALHVDEKNARKVLQKTADEDSWVLDGIRRLGHEVD